MKANFNFFLIALFRAKIAERFFSAGFSVYCAIFAGNTDSQRMKLLIDPSGGFAGDMFTAALISAGAPFERLRQVMLTAAEMLGNAEIDLTRATDGAARLLIRLSNNESHMPGGEGFAILEAIFDQYPLAEPLRDFALRTLTILLEAEHKAHHEHPALAGKHHHDSHSHGGRSPARMHTHPRGLQFAPDLHSTTFLHEAQDIVIDILGAAYGMQALGLLPVAGLHCPVSAGGGTITFSHGTLDVPSPATSGIFSQHRIPYRKGPIEKELCTPTGAALLAALGAKLTATPLPEGPSGYSRGTRDYPIPPLRVFLVQEVSLLSDGG